MKVSKVAGGISNSALAGLVVMLSGLVLIPLNISTVGAGQYGLWLTISAIGIVLYYSDLGVGLAIIHYGSRFRVGVGKLGPSQILSCGLAWVGTVWVAILPIFVFSVWEFMAPRFDELAISYQDRQALIVLGAVLLSGFLLRPFESTLVGQGYLNYERRNQVAGASVRVIGTVVACLVFQDIVAIAIAETIAILTPPVIAAFLVANNKIARFELALVRKKYLREMFRYSVRAFATGAVGAMILQAGTLIVASVGTPSDVTYYNAAFRLYSSVRQVITWITEPFRPLMSRAWTVDPEKGRSLLLDCVLMATSIGAVACIGMIISANDLVLLWLGADVPTDAISMTLRILLIGLLINMIHIPLVPALDGAGRPGAFFPLQVLWLVLFSAIAVPAGKSIGFIGVAIGLTIPILFLEPLYWVVANRALKIGIKNWMRGVAGPVAIIVVPALALSTAGHVIMVSWGVPMSSLVSAAIFGMVVITIVLSVPRRTRRADVVRTFRVDL